MREREAGAGRAGEIVDELVHTTPTADALRRSGSAVAVATITRERLVQREALGAHVLRGSGAGSATAELAALEDQVNSGGVAGHPIVKAEPEKARPRGGVPGARLEPRRRRPAKVGLTALEGRDVEVVTAGGGRHRGELVHAGEEWLTLARYGGRLVLVRTGGVVAITEETPGVPQ